MATKRAAESSVGSNDVTEKIAALGDWRGTTLARIRRLILRAVPDVEEGLKWRGTPVWSRGGIICTGESYKQTVKLTFARGAALADPHHLFNASLDGNVRRAIDLREGEALDEAAFAQLIVAAAAANAGAQRRRTAPKT